VSEAAERARLGARLKTAREYCGFSQEDVAKHLGVSRSSISLMESGSRGVDMLELRRLAALYQRPIAELAGEEEPSADDTSSIEIVTRATKGLSPEDREEVVRFAQFLKSRRKGLANDRHKG
jgi:transcriptional regulator with XRE-family HTH domain